MSKVDFRFQIQNNGRGVQMTAVVEGKPALQTFWTAEEIDGLTGLLSSVRRDMAVRSGDDRRARADGYRLVDPNYTVLPADERNTVILSLRHPGLDRIDLVLSTHHAAAILSDVVKALKGQG